MCNNHAVVHYKLIAMTELYIHPFYAEVYTSNELYQGPKLARHVLQ